MTPNIDGMVLDYIAAAKAADLSDLCDALGPHIGGLAIIPIYGALYRLERQGAAVAHRAGGAKVWWSLPRE